MAVISGVMFAGFPFDNLCTSEYLVVPEEFHRTWTVRPKIVDEQNWLIKQVFGDQSERIEVQISQNTSAYYYCLQDWRRAKFHEEDEDGESPLDIVWSESIQDEQGVVVYIFYILTLSCIGVSLLYYLCVCCRHLMSVSGIRYTYKARGRDQRRAKLTVSVRISYLRFSLLCARWFVLGLLLCILGAPLLKTSDSTACTKNRQNDSLLAVVYSRTFFFSGSRTLLCSSPL